jgi:HPt (histidine-containing phosphotransfer) domain-containing protein
MPSPAPVASTLDPDTIEELTRILGQDLEQFFGTFIACNAELLGQMTQFTEQDDCARFIVSVHSFKGSARNLGALRLADLLGEIEQQVRRSGFAGVDTGFRQIHQAFEDVCTALETYLH